jgi:hypothetical protein
MVNQTVNDAVQYIDPRLLDANSPGSAHAGELRLWEANGFRASPSPAEMLRSRSQQSQLSNAGTEADLPGGRPVDGFTHEVLENEFENQPRSSVEGMFSSPYYVPGHTPRQSPLASPYKTTSPFYPGPPELCEDGQGTSESHGLGISTNEGQPLSHPPTQSQYGFLPAQHQAFSFQQAVNPHVLQHQQQEPTPVNTPHTPALQLPPSTPPAKYSASSSRLTDTPGLVSDSDVDAEGDEVSDLDAEGGEEIYDDTSNVDYMISDTPQLNAEPSFPCLECDKTFGRRCDLRYVVYLPSL